MSKKAQKVRKAKTSRRTADNLEGSEQRHLRIYKTIRERISLLEYSPGSVLSEAELATEFEVSRTPIRRVLQRLHYEGLTEIRNGVGTIVKDIDIKTMKEIYDLRMHLAEIMGALSPGEITQDKVRAMESLLKKTKTLRKARNYKKYARLCNELEEIMLSFIGSAPLREITDMFYYRVSRIWLTFLPHLNWEEVVTNQEVEISSMIDAIKRGDLKGVGQIRRIHLNGILTQVSDYLKGKSTTSVIQNL